MSPTLSWILFLSMGWATYAWYKSMVIKSLQEELERNKPPF